nr:hypothetical protein [Tanacetum cinerariifolium]
MVGEVHKEAQQAAGNPNIFMATSEEGVHPQLSSGSNLSVFIDKTKSTGDGFKTAHIDSDESKEKDANKEETHDTSHDMPNDTSELPVELQALHVLVSSVQKQLKTLVFLPNLLNKVIKALNRFATIVVNASKYTTKDVPSTSQATDSPAEEKKNTKDADTNLKDELVDLLGTNVVAQYYSKKLLFDKYYDKMLKRKKNPKITNCKVLTKKGAITLKIYREDGSEEVISNLKFSDLHLVEWREVIQACPDRSEKGWKTIYDLVKTRLDQLT